MTGLTLYEAARRGGALTEGVQLALQGCLAEAAMCIMSLGHKLEEDYRSQTTCV
jgi:hypothetical protein